MKTRDPVRFRWDHRSAVHRTTVKAANRVLARLPFEAKYGATARLRDGEPSTASWLPATWSCRSALRLTLCCQVDRAGCTWRSARVAVPPSWWSLTRRARPSSVHVPRLSGSTT